MTLEELLEKLGYLVRANKRQTDQYSYYGYSDEALGIVEGRAEVSEDLENIIEEFKSDQDNN